MALAFVGWASGSADDDEIAAALWPEDFAAASADGVSWGAARRAIGYAGAFDCYAIGSRSGRADQPLRPWHVRPMMNETTEMITAAEDHDDAHDGFSAVAHPAWPVTQAD